MYLHYTDLSHIEAIVDSGLKVGQAPEGATVGVEWVLDFYDENPVYLTTADAPFIAAFTEDEWKCRPYFEVDTSGLSLAADIASLVDMGARYADGMLYVSGDARLALLARYADESGWIEIEHLVDPDTDLAAAAIMVTGTAACIEDIDPSRIKLVAPDCVASPSGFKF